MSANAFTLLRHIRRLATQAPPAPDSDAVLLGRFVRQRDEDAFAALVRRHGPLVLRVCRRVLADADAADDAFQATFCVLARKAGSVRPPEALASWLHGVAYRVALKARAGAVRRRQRVSAVLDLDQPAPHADPLAELSARELLAVVDEEVGRLPEAYRLPVILCCLEGRTREEAARLLGWTEGSVKGRLERGRARLHARLTRRGLTLTGALAAVEVARSAAPAAVVAEATARAALTFAAGREAASLSESVAWLALEGSGSSRLSGAALLLILGMGLTALTAGVLAHRGPGAATVPAAPVLAAEGGEPPRPNEGRQARTDRYGDPLPDGAVLRLGTVRFRVPDEVETLAFSPDGKTLAVSSRSDLFLMDAGSGKRLRRLEASSIPGRAQHRVVFSPGGKRLAVRGNMQDGNRYRGVVRVWDLAGGGQPKVYGAEHSVWAGWSADGEPLTVCLEAGALRLDELASGQSRHFKCKDLRGPGRGDYVICTCAPGGKALAAVDEQARVHVWDIPTGRERCTLRPKGPSIPFLALSPDGQTLASWSTAYAENGGATQVWDATTGKLLHTILIDQSYLGAFDFSPDGKTLATAGVDVRFWDVATGRKQGRTRERFGFAPSVAFSPDGKTLATAESNGHAVHFWDVPTGKRHAEPVGHSCRPYGTAFSPDGRRVATGGGLDGTIRIWDLATAAPLAEVRRPEWVRGIALSRDGRTLFSTWTDDSLWVCDATTGERQAVIKLEDPDRPDTRQSAISMYQSADGKSLVALSYYYPKRNGSGPASQDTLITGWDTSTRQQRFRRRRPGMESWLVLSPDTRVLAAPHAGERLRPEFAPGKGPMRLEDVATGELLLTFPAPEGQTWPLAFSPDGRLLASNNSDYTRQGKPGDPARATGNVLRLWETATTAEVLVLPASGNTKAAFSPDGRLLAMSAPAREIVVWDLALGREVRRFKGFDADVSDLGFSPDGRRLLSGLWDSTFLVWDTGPSEKTPAGKLGAEGLARAWADLAGADGPRALRARWMLVAAPDEALPLLTERLRPARATDPQRLRRLLDDLNSDEFPVRAKAQAALEELSDLDAPVLRRALANHPAPEVRRRVEAVLDRLRGPVTMPEVMRSVRAVAVLEDIGTPPARRLLDELAAGPPEARLTREAKGSLERLTLRPPRVP